EAGGGFAYEAEIKLTLIGLGFPKATWQTPLSHLSGGKKTRILLARLLLEAPDLLILDEPTNHLDLKAVEWLENKLRKWSGSLIVVSHDRYFLDRVVSTIWALTARGLKTYRGDYAHYVLLSEQEEARAQSLFSAEKKRLAKELDFIRQHVADGQSDAAKGKLRRLTRDIVLLERYPITEIEGKSWLEIGGRVRTFSANEAAQRLSKLRRVSDKPQVMRVAFQAEESADEIILRGRDLQFGYAETLVTASALQVERGNRIAILGTNGSGKTTILKTLFNHLTTQSAPSPTLLAGELEAADELTVGYFAQAHDQLDPDQQLIEAIMTVNPTSKQAARHWLAKFLFRGHDVFKRVRDLSGGERGRLALAILALQGGNLLLLDEPTNHLDIPSQEVLQAALAAYDGTLILVSHDRYLVSKLATHIWDLRAGKLYVYADGYADYLERRALDIEHALHGVAPAPTAAEMAVDDLLAFQHGYAEEVAETQPSGKNWRKRMAELEDLLDAAEAQVAVLQSRLEQGEAVEAELLLAEETLGLLSAEWDNLV
ncbi:MAG TPA: ABC-F family ATP-binding cassette domain-containing protein, partial [Anaerolineae bacterium]|nr:ABC-F family ATP-binding cassette domain-containing protein [Anaerolineae bacterium]